MLITSPLNEGGHDKNKTQRQIHITLGYLLVQYHFALHPPFKKICYVLFKFEIKP